MSRSRATSSLLLLFIGLLGTPGLTNAQSQPDPLLGLDGYIEQAMRDWEVPGLAIAVVRNDSVIFARGYGVRQQGGQEAVDEHTLFAIASTSKAMTAAGLGMLVDEGRIAWDDPVTQHLPTFHLQDPYVNREFTVRDLLTHRSGLARHDLLWIAAPFDRTEILRRARHLPSSGRFRADYGYHNVMYIAAGEVVTAASGVSWDDFLADRLFRPLGMTRSTTRSAIVDTRDNVATSHTRVDGAVTAVARRNYDNIGGAGAVWSSAHDMGQWVRLQLGDGSLGGARILSSAALREMHTPQTLIRSDSVSERLFPDTHFRAYGLGWNVQDYRGRKMVHHSGSINWTRTQVGMLPAEGVGVVVIANLSSSDLQRALMYRVLDAYLGAESRDWSAELLELSRRSDERGQAQSRELEAARIRGTRPSLPETQLAGTYSSELFGEMRLQRENGRLVLYYAPDYIADLEHWHHDTFRALWRRPGFGSAFVTFALDARGRPATIDVGDFGVFRRNPG
jgi:CubicO group peptidase (beta-lactamase class C family)